MDTELLRTFLEVSHTRHFGKAAENLYLTQAAVSSRIRQLENQLGVQVFLRERNNLRLTPAGERLLPHADAILTGWQRARQEVAVGAEQNQQLAVGATQNIWDILIGDPKTQLVGLLGVALRLDNLPQEVITRRLLERTLDVGLMFDSPKADDLQCRTIAEVALVMVSGRAGLSMTEALREHYILVDWGTAFSVQHAKLYGRNNIPPALHTNMARIALNFIHLHGGSAYLPEPLVMDELQHEALYRVENAPVIMRSLVAVYHDEPDREELIQPLLEQLGI